MRFSNVFIAALTAAAPISAAVIDMRAVEERALSSAQLVKNIDELTTLSEKLQPVVDSIQTGQNIIFKRASTQSTYQQVISGFTNIIQVISRDVQVMGNSIQYPDDEAKKICASYARFVAIETELLDKLASKSDILIGVFGGPVQAVVRQLENALDTLSFSIIDQVPVCAADSTQKLESLDAALKKAICAYAPLGALGVTLDC